MYALKTQQSATSFVFDHDSTMQEMCFLAVVKAPGSSKYELHDGSLVATLKSKIRHVLFVY